MCCYCEVQDAYILSDILNVSIPANALTGSCSWRRICQVRGRNFSAIDFNVWFQVCQERGYLFVRSNSRSY